MANTTIDTVVRNFREMRGLGIRELARLAECSDGTIRRIEAGEQDPAVTLARRLLDALDVDETTRSALLARTQS